MENSKKSYIGYLIAFVLVIAIVICIIYFALRFTLQSDFNKANIIIQKQIDELAVENSRLKDDFGKLDSAKVVSINKTTIIKQELIQEKNEIKNQTDSESVEYFNAYVNEYRNAVSNEKK